MFNVQVLSLHTMESKTNHSLIICEKKQQNLERKKVLMKQRKHWMDKTLHSFNLLHQICNDHKDIILQQLYNTLSSIECVETLYINNIESVKSDTQTLDESFNLQKLEEQVLRKAKQFLYFENQYGNQTLINSNTNIEEEHNITCSEYEAELKKLQATFDLFQVNYQDQPNLLVSFQPFQNELNEELNMQLELKNIKHLYHLTITGLMDE